MVFAREERHRLSRLARSTRTSTSMHKVLRRQGESHIDDQPDIRDIQTSRGDVCSDQDILLTSFKRFEGFKSGFLSHIAVESADSVAGSADGVFKTLSFFFVQCKDENTGGRRFGIGVSFKMGFEVVSKSEATVSLKKKKIMISKQICSQIIRLLTPCHEDCQEPQRPARSSCSRKAHRCQQ